jgi:hypothetical protein
MQACKAMCTNQEIKTDSRAWTEFNQGERLELGFGFYIVDDLDS